MLSVTGSWPPVYVAGLTAEHGHISVLEAQHPAADDGRVRGVLSSHGRGVPGHGAVAGGGL